MLAPELLLDAKALLGEGPIWDSRTQALYWIDILSRRIYSGADLLAELDDFVGCIAPRQSGGLVLTQRLGLDKASFNRYPLTGGVFRLPANVEGMPTFECVG